MNIQRIAALVAGSAAVVALVGCPNVIPGTNPTGTPSWDAASQLTGQVTYDGGNVAYQDASYTQKVEVKESGAANRLGVTADLEQGKYFQFKNLTEGKAYQAIIDYKGAEPTKAADVNAIRLYVSAPATASAAANDPMISFDLEWVMNPKPEYNASSAVPVAFSWTGIQNLSADYQVQVVSAADNSTVWSSAWGTGTSVSWNGKRPASGESETNSPTGTDAAAGNYKYRVKFRQTGGTFGGANVYGESQLIPFTLTR